MKTVKRYNPETLYGEQPWYTSEANMDESEYGDYVLFSDYSDLLEKYEELKFSMDGLDK